MQLNQIGKKVFQLIAFAIISLYGRCSSLKFRWAMCPTASKAEGIMTPFGSNASNICDWCEFSAMYTKYRNLQENDNYWHN